MDVNNGIFPYGDMEWMKTEASKEVEEAITTYVGRDEQR